MASKKNQAAQQTADAPQAAAPQQDAQQTADAATGGAGAAEVVALADTAPEPVQPAAVALPDSVTLASPYGFFDDDDTFQSWAADQVVTDPAHIELLIARGAPLAE